MKNLVYSERSNIVTGRSGQYNMPGSLLGASYLDEQTAAAFGVDPKNFPTEIYYLSGHTYPSFVEGSAGLSWIFLSKKQFQFFVKGGLAVNYLFENTFDEAEIYHMTISYADNGSGQLVGTPAFDYAPSLAEAQDANHMTKANMHYLGGLGIRFNINKGILFFETRYQRSIFKQKVKFESNSEIFSAITQELNKPTLDFQTQTLSFSFGYLFRIQNFRRLRQ